MTVNHSSLIAKAERLLLASLGYLALLGGQASQAAPVTPLAFSHIQTKQPYVALTFDCCQTAKPAGYDRAIVDFLAKHRTPATFFLGGRWIEAHQKETRYLASVSFFELDNHSYIHPHMTKVSVARMGQELTKTQSLLRKYAGLPAGFFRPPYGEWNYQVEQEAAKAGMSLVTWSVATGDPDRHATVADLLGEFRKVKPGSVVIMHANGGGWKTAQALPAMLTILQKRGLRPVTLNTLVASGKPVVMRK